MKLITLNVWGGKLFQPLIDFFHQYSAEVDIFCLQEVFDSSVSRIFKEGMHPNLFAEISDVLTNFQGYFAPYLKGRDLERPVDFDIAFGNAIFFRKTINVTSRGVIPIYRKGFDLIKDDYKTIPRNLQYIKFKNDSSHYLLSHFHGVWYPRTKLDTDERIKQSQKIRSFLDKDKKSKKLLCGDFNLLPKTKSMDILEKGMRNLVREFKIKTTRNFLYKGKEKYADYILVSPDVKVINFKVIDAFVSDHLPLFLNFN